MKCVSCGCQLNDITGIHMVAEKVNTTSASTPSKPTGNIVMFCTSCYTKR